MVRTLVLAAALVAALAAPAAADDECSVVYEAVMACYAAGQETGDPMMCTKLADDTASRLEGDGMEAQDAGQAGEACEQLCEDGSSGGPRLSYDEFAAQFCKAE
ncbi:MAG: hypothetical protein AB7D57_11265 [Desulfovibrionaceae bacterium]